MLIGEHGDEGAMGVVLNRASETLVEDAVPPMATLTAPDELVYLGGPVQPEAVVVLADFADVEQAEVAVVDSIGFLPGEIEDTSAIGELRGVRVFAGLRGLGPGTARGRARGGCLDRRHRSQLRCVHEPRRSSLWRDVLRREGGALAHSRAASRRSTGQLSGAAGRRSARPVAGQT